jgi:hypothetical protein
MDTGFKSVGVALALIALPARAALPTQAEALALAYPGAKTTRHERFLTEAQAARVKALAGTELKSRFVVVYEVQKDGQPAGTAFFDAHTVRTQAETAMVAVTPAGKVSRVEVVTFQEPEEYKAPAAWVKQLEGQSLSNSLSLKGDIRPLSGASLTAQALTDAARRCLALWRILYHGDQP